MKIVEINMCSFGSTGRIIMNIAEQCRKNGHDVLTCSTYHFSKTKYKELSFEGHYLFGNKFEVFIHNLIGSFFGLNGFLSRRATKKLVKKVEQFNPDIIHIHNLHWFCINLPILFDYFKKCNIPIVWTLHDCWSFTGHCTHFAISGCDKWKFGCKRCKYHHLYPKTYFENTHALFLKKKKLFCSVDRLFLVTPSEWLKGVVMQSFLSNKQIQVINNGVDLSVFRPTKTISKYLVNYNGKKIILGVAFAWGYSKGLDVFNDLAKKLNDDYKIVLVGVDDNTQKYIDKKIICIKRTENQQELAELYSSSFLFFNPTREDTFPTVNIEALACGIPVLTYNSCGSPEIVDESCGIVLNNRSIPETIKAIEHISKNPFLKENCVARAARFNKDDLIMKYYQLFNSIAEAK